MSQATEGRVDAWLWSVRIFPTRSQATAACRAGHVQVGGTRAKPATLVRPGDRVTVTGGQRTRLLVVQRVLTKRVAATVAAEAMLDQSPPPLPRAQRPAPVFERDRGTGRPTKRDRRQLDRLRGSSG